jgi:hypothetical protein
LTLKTLSGTAFEKLNSRPGTLSCQEGMTLINDIRKEKHEIDMRFNQLMQNLLPEEMKK